MKLKLVGSRALGNNTPDSDWDVAVEETMEGTVVEGDNRPYPLPKWDSFLTHLDINSLRAQAREEFNIPKDGKIDLFFTVHCEGEARWPWGLVVVTHDKEAGPGLYGYTVCIAENSQMLVDKATGNCLDY